MARPKEAWVLAERLDNVGDLALLYQAAYGLRRHTGLKEIKVRQWAPPTPQTRTELAEDGISIVSGKRIRSLFPGRRLLVYAGGQAVRSNASTISMLALITTMVSSVIAGGKRAGLGIGASELPQRGFMRQTWRAILSTFTILTTRDDRSQERLQCLISRPHPKLTDDLAFLPSPLHGRLAGGASRDHFVIAPCRDSGESRILLPETAGRWAELIAEKLNVDRFVVVCHDARPEMDLAVADEIKHVLRSRGHVDVRVVTSGNLNEVLEIYRSSAGVLTNRLHAMIFGLLARKPAFALMDGNDKVATFAGRFGVPLLKQDEGRGRLRSREVDAGLTEAAIANREQALAAAMRAAERNFLMLRRLLYA